MSLSLRPGLVSLQNLPRQVKAISMTFRSKSLQATPSSRSQNEWLAENPVDEVDDCRPVQVFSSGINGRQNRRKYGVLLAGVAAGTVAAGIASKFDDEFTVLKAAEQIKPPTADFDIKAKRRQQFNFIADVVAETAPAVVYIKIKDLRVRDYFTGEPVVSSNGSGFIVASDGLILTNAHVVAGRRAAIEVVLQDGRTFEGRVQDVDMRSDLAKIRINASDLPVMRLGSSSAIRPGEFVIAMGSPLSLANTVTSGVISSPARKGRELKIPGRDVPDYIQTDAAITFGNSGGPLVNLAGEAIGINSLKVTPGISFAIPIDYAKEFLAKRPAGPRRAYLGITMLAITPEIVDELRSRMTVAPRVDRGIVVYRVVEGSPADKAGIQPGDIITHINGRPVQATSDVHEAVETNSVLQVAVVRKLDSFVVNVKL